MKLEIYITDSMNDSLLMRATRPGERYGRLMPPNVDVESDEALQPLAFDVEPDKAVFHYISPFLDSLFPLFPSYQGHKVERYLKKPGSEDYAMLLYLPRGEVLDKVLVNQLNVLCMIDCEHPFKKPDNFIRFEIGKADLSIFEGRNARDEDD